MTDPASRDAASPGCRGVERRLLLVEDDRAIADAVARRLRSEGYGVDVVHDGLAAVRETAARRYDAVVLDVMLPGLDGIEVCRRVQARAPVPVLMLSARAAETDRLVGLGVGADDYLTKPFSPRELVARVAALLRRVERAAQLVGGVGEQAGDDLAAGPAAAARPGGGLRPLVVGRLHVDVTRRRVLLDGAEVALTRTEFDLLVALAARPGTVLGRERLLAEVWQWRSPRPPGGAGRTVDSHVKSLRRKLGHERIRTVHGVGYALEEAP